MKTLESVSDMVLDTLLASVQQVIPMPAVIHPQQLFQDTVVRSDIGVLIGFTGNLYGRIVIQGQSVTFSKLGEAMFGMPLDGDMLHSFVAELSNMLAGTTGTLLAAKGQSIDITPPTVMLGKLQLFDFKDAVCVPVDLLNIGEINIVLLIQQ